MQIQLDTRLMPQYLPGSPASAAWTQVDMAPTNDGQVLLFTTDADGQLTLWLSSDQTTARWQCVSPVLGGRAKPRVVQFAMHHHNGRGRHDGTIDLGLIADVGDGTTPALRWFVWPRVPASNDPSVWAQRFVEATPEDTHGLVPALMHWGQAPRHHSSRLLQGRQADGSLALLWQRFGLDGQAVQTEAETMPPDTPADSVLTTGCLTARDENGDWREGFARCLVSEARRQGHMTLIWPAEDGSVRHETPLPALNGSLHGWTPSEGLWPLTPRDGVTWLYFNTDRGDQGVIHATFTSPRAMATVATVEAAPVPGAVRALHQVGTDAGVLRLERTTAHGHAELLRLTRSATLNGAGGRSTFLEADVSAFAVCECRLPDSAWTVLHVLVGYREGGLSLLSQDNVSGLWNRSPVADDNVASGIHLTTSQTTRIRVIDDSGAPVPNASVRLRVQTPCHAVIGGRSMHLSPVVDTVVPAGPSGEITLIQPTDGLAATRADIEVVADQQAPVTTALNPMQRMADRMRTIASGQALRDVIGSDGKRPFAHCPIDKCDVACLRLQPLLRAYDATLVAPALRGPGMRVVERVVLSGTLADTTPTPVDQPATPQDALDDIGDMLACLWNADQAANTPELLFLENGLAELVIKIGDTLWTALIDDAEQAVDLIDWSLQTTLGVSLDDLVNWLGQVFDWPAILATHRTMGKLATLAQRQTSQWMRNSAANMVTEHMAWARKTLSHMPDLDPATRARLERPVPSGDGQPATASAPVQGPDAQWGMQTFDDHSSSAQVKSGGAWNSANALAEVIGESALEFKPLVDEFVAGMADIDFNQSSLLTVFEDAIALIAAGTVDALGHMALKLLPLLADMMDDAWELLGQRLDIPVLTTLYEEVLAPGSTFSLLDMLLLAAAVAGEIGSRIASGQALISPALAQAIDEAPDLVSLLGRSSTQDAAVVWATDVQGVMTLLGGVCKLMYYGCWVSLRHAPADSAFDAPLVRAKCGFDCAAWGMSMAWATVKCTVHTPPAEALKGSVAFLVVDGLISRTKDAVEMARAKNNEGINTQLSEQIAGVESILGGTLLGGITIFTSISSATMRRVEPSDEGNWNLLLVLPMLQSFATASYMALALPEKLLTKNPTTATCRTVLNGIRSTAPLASIVALGVAARNDWNVPGTIAD